MAPSTKTTTLQHSRGPSRKSAPVTPMPVGALALALCVGVLLVVGVRLVSGPAPAGTSAKARP